jgi:PAS domain S-box-containing protein
MPAGMRGDEALFLRAPIPMWVFDRETLRFLAVNDEAVERYGYPRDAFLSMTIEEIRPPEDVPRVREEVARPRASRGSTGTWRHVRRDGSTIDVEVTAVDVTYAGRPARLVAVVDVTERERARRERDRTEARSAAIVASSLDAIVLMDHEGRITEFNPAAERIFGYRREEVLGRPLAETIVPPELRARHREGLARFRRTGRGRVLGRRLELTGMRADGTTFPVELSIVRVDLPGEPLFAGTIRDITDRKRAEEELAAWGAVFELARWGIAEVDPAARTIVRANPAFAAMHGYAPDELIGRPPIELYAPEERHRVRKAVAEATRTGHHVFEAARLRRDGSTFHALVDLTVVRDEGAGRRSGS